MKRSNFAAGFLAGVLVVGITTTAYAAGIMAQRSVNRVFVDGQEVQLEAYTIHENNFMQLRDIGKAVGFNVYWRAEDGSVQIETGKTYTGTAPRQSNTVPTDGSRYVPTAGDVIRCNDGTDYVIKDVSRWDKNAFSSGPLGELPTATCDWSSFPEVVLPAVEARHINNSAGDYLFLRNLYESRRMQYTIQNLAGNHPDTSTNGKLRYSSKGTPYVRIQLAIDDTMQPQSFWPWRASELEKQFDSCPAGLYAMEAWDVYRNGVFLYTEYCIDAI